MIIVDRKFLQQTPNTQDDVLHPKPLYDFFDCDALVVLGDPGAGKSTSFEQAASQEPEAVYVKIRDFMSLKTKRYQGKTLYLDGLDEQRSKTNDGTAILDELRQRLDELDSPRFRISCRSADWYGSSDLESLSKVAPSESITVISIEPLTENDIATIASERVADPQAFLEEAGRRGIDELLINPQTLDLILTVVETNDWPASRTELFEKACEILLREQNTEHDRAHQDKADKKMLLEAAGYLCAVILCGGLEGVALSSENADESFPCIAELGQNIEALRLVAQRRLFKGAGPEQRMPLHRTIAEFLSANFLKHRISNGLPVGRVTSLLTGFDGGILSDLRGIYAWLVCLCPQCATSLIPVDPLGIILYGDVAPLAPSTKKVILTNLQFLAKRHPWFHPGSRNSVAFGSLACPELVKDFRAILTDSRESNTVKYCVLDAIHYGTLSELSSDLMTIARNSQEVSYIRREAIQAFHVVAQDNPCELTKLLDAIHTGVVSDDGCYLRSELLRILYPTALSPNKLVQHLVACSSKTAGGGYSNLFSHGLLEKTGDDAIPALIEAVAQSGTCPRNDYYWGHFVGGLVCKGLNLYGETIGVETLYRWLSATLTKDRISVLRADEKLAIRAWLDAHHSRVLELFEFCIALSAIDKLYLAESRFNAMTHGTIRGNGLYNWFLNKAATEAEESKAEFYFIRAGHMLFSESDDDKPTLEELYSFVEKHTQFSVILKKLVTTEITDWRFEDAKRSREEKIEEVKIKAENNRIFARMLDRIRTGNHPSNLNLLACYYKGDYPGSNNDSLPFDRLVESTNLEIATAALEGFQAVLYRNDLPTPHDIAKFRVKNKSYYIGLPLLIGMGLTSTDKPTHAFNLPEATLKSAIIFHYVEYDEKEPSWLHGILSLHPALAAEAFLDFWKPQLKSRREHIDGIYELDNKPEFEFIANSVVLPLLAEFPNCHPSSLEHLLWAALLHSKWPDLLELARKVLAKPGAVRGKQRILWFSTGFLVASVEFNSGLRTFVGNNKDRTYFFLRHVTGALKTFSKSQCFLLDHKKLGMVIEIVASVFPPFDRSQKTDARVTDAENASRTIYDLIDKLRAMPEVAAGDTLKQLISRQTLKYWRDDLLHALAIQQQNCREAAFRYPTTQQVIETIHGGKPANVMDLKEVVLNHLKTLRDEYRNGPLDGYKDFWNLDSNGRAIEAIPENNCRDRLLGRLKPLLLQQGIQAEPEGHFAEDKRADIKVLFSSLVLPVEIKRHYHKDIWTAATEQLQKRYSRDPGSFGHGIYLVFWFGSDYRKAPKPPNNSVSLTSAMEFEEEIKNTIPDEIKSNIEVIVFDCSRPIVPKGKVKSEWVIIENFTHVQGNTMATDSSLGAAGQGRQLLT